MPNTRAQARDRHAVSRAFVDAIEPLENRLLMARTLGIDVSHWQGTINWTSVATAGKKFAFQKATEGDFYVDPTMATNMANGKAAGLMMGVYHFPDPTTVADANADGLADEAITEANYFYAQAGNYMKAGYIKPVLDMEAGAGLGKTNLSKWTLDFCARIKTLSGVDPIIYVNSNYAVSYMTTTVANTYKLWFAEPGHTDAEATGTTNPSNSLGAWTTAGKTWSFWQYSWTGAVSGISGNVDLDTYAGDITSLQTNFLIGALPTTPATPSPANAATNVSRTNLKLDWANSTNATSYDVYFGTTTTPTTKVATDIALSEWTVSPAVGAGTYYWQVIAKNANANITGPIWSFTVASLPAPVKPATPNHNGDIVTTKPVTLDWADSASATSYDLYLGNSPKITLTESQLTGLNPTDGVRTWRVVAVNVDGSTSGDTWSYTLDTVAPTASLTATTPTSGGATFDFTVTYNDVTSGVLGSSLGAGDITVTGPNGFSQIAQYLGVDIAGNGATRIVTYRIAAPGGTWDAADNGSYTVMQNASEVRDVGGLFRPATAIGIFATNAASPFAYVQSNTLHIDYVGTNSATVKNDGAGNYVVTENAVDITIVASTFSNIIVHGTANDDAVILQGVIAKPLTIDGQTGNDSLTLANGASYAFDSDIATQSANLAITVASGATATFNASQHLSALSIAGGASLNGAGKALVTKALDVTGTLDLKTNSLIVDYGSDDPIGDWQNSAYTGVTGMVQGNRIMTSIAETNRTGLAVSETKDAMSLTDTRTALFAGETVDATAVMVKFSYVGDANLDGMINADDYAFIDLYSQAPASYGYFRGDFNYDGAITADDYALIDVNILLQGLPLV